MKSSWLTASSFERMHEILAAINTISIYAKLALAGVKNPTSAEEIGQARANLLTFLRSLAAVLKESQQELNAAVVGADPRLGELALRFLASGRITPQPGSSVPLPRLISLVDSERPEDLNVLIQGLQELRAIIEEETREDVAGILGLNPLLAHRWGTCWLGQQILAETEAQYFAYKTSLASLPAALANNDAVADAGLTTKFPEVVP